MRRSTSIHLLKRSIKEISTCKTQAEEYHLLCTKVRAQRLSINIGLGSLFRDRCHEWKKKDHQKKLIDKGKDEDSWTKLECFKRIFYLAYNRPTDGRIIRSDKSHTKSHCLNTKLRSWEVIKQAVLVSFVQLFPIWNGANRANSELAKQIT